MVPEKARKVGNFLCEMGTETDRSDERGRCERDLRRINGKLNKEEADIGVHVVRFLPCFLRFVFYLCPHTITMYLSAPYNRQKWIRFVSSFKKGLFAKFCYFESLICNFPMKLTL